MPDEITFEGWQRWAATQLADNGSSTPQLDATLLLKEVTGVNSASLISMSKDSLSTEHLNSLEALMRRRLSGEPVHRILGWREFYSRKFLLSPETLVPRPDTETLIDAVLNEVGDHRSELRIIDLGTGSGAIAVTLAAELTQSHVVATDISSGALTTAQQNAQRLNVADRIDFLQSDLFEAVTGTYHLIVSNPPYIPDGDIGGLQVEVREHDPRTALAGGKDGLEFYRAIFSTGRDYLSRNGSVHVEIGAGMGDSVEAIARQHDFEISGRFADLGGITRVISARSV